LALIYVGLFAAAIIGLFGYVYWSTVSYVRAEADRPTAAERAQLDDGFARSIAGALGTAVGLFILLAAAAGISTARRSVSRIEAINATSREIMRAGLGRRVPLRGTGDEWDELAANLNSMLDRIGELVEANRQVSDNIAHDLRTPLTRMRGRLERACNQPLAAAEYRSILGEAIAELDGVLRTFLSLLRISQIEACNPRAGFHNLDLAGLVREVAELFDASAEEHAVSLRISGEQNVAVFGDRDLLFDALSNLLDNAIKHGGCGGEVGIAVHADPEGRTVSIADRGPGIPAEEHRHVFERFYRLEQSRNSPGNGLGLSLVAAVANLHDMRIQLDDNAPGLKVTLHFPSPPKNAVGGEAATAHADVDRAAPVEIDPVHASSVAQKPRRRSALMTRLKCAAAERSRPSSQL
jgi:signal transduction histidine kinase